MRVITDTGELPILDTIIIQGRGELNPFNQTLRFKPGKDYTHPDFSSPTYNPSTQTYDFAWADQGPYVALLSPRDGSVGTPVWDSIGLEYIDKTLATAGDVITFNGTDVVWSAGGGGGGGGGVTSASLSMPSAFSVTGSPITSAGTFIVSGAGTSAQYIDGTGALATFPTIPSGTVTSVGTAGLLSGGTITSSGTITTSISTNRLVGRTTTGTGVMEEIQIGSGLLLSSGTLSAYTQSEDNQIFLNQWNTAPNIKGTAAMASGSISSSWIFSPRYLPLQTTISQIAFRATSCSVNTSVRIGMYTSRYDSTLGAFLPDSLLADSGLIPVTTTDPFPTINAYTLPTSVVATGWIFLCIRPTSPSLFVQMTPNPAATTIMTLYPAILNAGSGTSGQKFIQGTSSASPATSPLPATWTATVNISSVANIQLLYFRPI